jgi:hypothetical protein
VGGLACGTWVTDGVRCKPDACCHATLVSGALQESLHLRGQMPRYIFAIRAVDGDTPERAAELNDDAAALAYACEIVRELNAKPGPH